MAIIKRGTRFPSDNIIKRYYSDFFITIVNTGVTATLNQIYISPIFVKRRIINPAVGIQQIGAGGSTTIDLGIYEGKDIFNSPRLLWRNTMTTSGIAVIQRITSNVVLEMGWYFLASVRTGANSPALVGMHINPQRNVVGTLTTETTFLAIFGTYISTITSPATTLPNPLTGVTFTTGATVPAIFLEY